MKVVLVKIPLKNLGLLTKTTFIIFPPKINYHYLQHPQIAKTINQIARIATKHFGGSKQLAIIPKAKVIAEYPLP